jgi:hypothetical protein
MGTPSPVRESESWLRFGGRRRYALLPVLAAAIALAAAPAAKATFHEMSIREVYPGGADNASYVELQMWAAGQNFVLNHHLVAYNANGSVNEDFKFAANVANGSNQATILVADSSYGSVFPGKPAPDASDASLNLSPAGGAVCWVEGSPPDCVAWGSFVGPFPAHLPVLVAGSPASPTGVGAGKALRRSIAAPCSTLLELSDDTDDSAADFSEQAPNPRDNASPIVEKACIAPTAIIDSKPANPTKSTSAAFSYHSSPAGAEFECKLDLGAFEACEASGIEYAGPLGQGSHSFQVRAKDANGTGAPVKYEWKVDTTPPTATIKEHPSQPDPSSSARFTYQSDEPGSTFQCSLVEEGQADAFGGCPLGEVEYKGLNDMTVYVFKVRAVDPATNQGSPAVFSWEVDSTAPDITPPQTFIDSRPPDPSASPVATFAYHASEAGSTFECSLDGGAFASCPSASVTYSGLGNGQHSFQVRAVDPSHNVDPSPAGYTFGVVLANMVGPLPVVPPAGVGPPPAPSPSPPMTVLVRKPAARTHDRTPTFKFRSDAPGSTFECKLDRARFKPCRSPFTTKKLAFGRHTIQIRAVLAGAPGPTPAAYGFKVVRRR